MHGERDRERESARERERGKKKWVYTLVVLCGSTALHLR